MLRVACAELRRRGHRTKVCSFNPLNSWSQIVDEEVVELLPRAMGNVASAKRANQIRSLFFLPAAWRAQSVYIIGGDILDGRYGIVSAAGLLEYAFLAQRMGMEVSLSGFSINRSPDPVACKWLGELPRDVHWHTRDEISQERLTRLVGRDVGLTADLAFLLEPAPLEILRESVVEFCRDSVGHTIAVNLHPQLLSENECELSDVEFGKALLHALAARFTRSRFVLVVHDTRGIHGDQKFLQSIAAGVSNDLNGRCEVVGQGMSATEMRTLCGHFDLALCGRMHLAIGCLSMGVPTVAFGYQGKFEGMYRHFKLEGMVFAPKRLSDIEAVVEKLAELKKKRKQVSRQIRERLPEVRELAMLNFQ